MKKTDHSISPIDVIVWILVTENHILLCELQCLLDCTIDGVSPNFSSFLALTIILEYIVHEANNMLNEMNIE